MANASNLSTISANDDMVVEAESGDREAQEANRRILLKRLMDVVAMPASNGNLQDRAIAGDLLLELLVEAEPWARELCSRRLQYMTQAPKRLLRFLALDVPSVSDLILAENKGLDDSDLREVIVSGGMTHRAAVAVREDIGPSVATAIAESGDVRAMELLLKNRQAVLSDRAVDVIVSASRESKVLVPLLVDREEIRPAHALAMFWWCGHDERVKILRRFSADRGLLIEGCSDIFKTIAKQGIDDPIFKKAMQVIERRQRNRRALEKSQFESLEEAIRHSRDVGVTIELSNEISNLAGIRPETGTRIFNDEGGEGLAILCKATGLRRDYLGYLWEACWGEVDARPEDFAYVLNHYETLAVAKAQTVLRYWDWCMETAYAPEPDARHFEGE